VAQVEVFDAPGGARRDETVPNPNEHGVVATFLVRTRGVETAGQIWHEVYLPIRPNGSVGWIRDRDVDLTYTDLRVIVRLGEHRLDVLSEGEVIASYPAGIGRADTPTPGGVFFIKELLQPSDPNGPYGPYAFGLSGFSNVIVDDDRFGEGVIGIHGTNRPDLVGTDVSHGCIRLRNEDVVALVGLLPLGTPVEILE
jgi:lipoprotein-anchoring transpeptidase ErfK/SrfK